MPEAAFALPEPAQAVEGTVVYLTIDDGPSLLTEDILELLREHDAGATFFLHTDHIVDDTVLTAIASSGLHNTGHHMPSDRDWSEVEEAAFRSAYLRSHCLLAEANVPYSGWFRPPRGRTNPSAMEPVIRSALGDEAPAYLMASYVPWDAGGATETPYASLNHSVAARYGYGLARAARPGDIVVFHDGPRTRRTENTLHSLSAFLRGLDKRGIRAAALPPLAFSTTDCATA
jgi:peptidoglycan/xylan/chitin deacetylase (PgdA/CDA1 family)